MVEIKFFVPGIPQTKGSTRGFVGRSKKTGKPVAIITNDNPKNKPWARQVAMEARKYAPAQPMAGPVYLELAFFLKRPQRPKHPVYPITKPDLDKTTRSIKDALKDARIYRDDSQVCAMHCRKFGIPGVSIAVKDMEGL